MSKQRLIFRLEGSDDDRGNVHLGDFIKQLDAIRHALKETDRVLNERPATDFIIVDLSHSSPATIVIEEIPRPDRRTTELSVLNTFFANLVAIMSGDLPPRIDYDAIHAYQRIGARVGRRVKSVQVRSNSQSVTLTPDFGRRIDQILGPDEVEYGSVSGRLEQINLHGQRVFTIYPALGLRRLRCAFPNELRAEAVKAVDRYVRVYGRLRFKRGLDRSHPYEMAVQQIEVAPLADELPTLSSLRGIAADVELDAPSEEVVRRIRDEWDEQ
ncbi:MAG: hypothetical protein RML99_12190 [Anaerolineae bacterium]|nr:hypothetical protein [Anaerolineae bacterium]